MLLLLCKLTLTPLMIGLSLWASRRWGVLVGSALAGLPSITGPGLFFVMMENGAGFATYAARSALAGFVAVIAYMLIYAYMARRWPASFCLVVALAGFMVGSAVIKWLDISLWFWVVMGSFSPILCLKFLPVSKKDGPLPRVPRWKIPVQMVLGCVAVLLITEFSTCLGVFWSGIFLSFPVMSSLVIPFAHTNYGADSAINSISGLLYGVNGSVVFNLFLAVALDRINPALAFILAGVLALVVGMFCVVYQSKKAARGSGGSVA